MTKENFFFKIDENKRRTNLKVYDYTAPGNKFRKPNVILPHEHVNVSKYIDIDGNDKE